MLAACALAQQADSRYPALAAQLIAAADQPARERLLLANPPLVNIELRRALIAAAGEVAIKNEFAPAQRIFEIACEVSTRIADATGIASCAYNVGLMLARQNREEEGLAKLQESLVKFAALGDHKYQGRALNNIALIYAHRNQFDLYLETAEKALLEKQEAGDPKEELNTRVGLGITYRTMGQFDTAAQHLTAALDLARSVGSGKSIADALGNLSELYYELGDIELALRYAQENVALREGLADKRGYANAIDILGLVYARKKQTNLARETYDRALRQALAEKDDETQMTVPFHLGNLLSGLHENGSARQKLEESRAWAQRLSRPSIIHHINVSLAVIDNDEKRWEEAVALCEPALDFGQRTNEPLLASRAGAVLADALRQLGRAAAAEPLLRAAIGAIEAARDHIATEPETAMLYMEDKAGVYYRLVELLHSRGRHEEALLVAEQSRARVVLDVLRSGNVNIDRALTDDERRKDALLRAQVAGLRQAGTPGARQRLDNALSDYRLFKNELYARHPELRAQRLETEPVRPAELMARLPEAGAALLEYVAAGDAVTLIVVTAGERGAVTRGYTLPVSAPKLEGMVKQFRDAVATRDLGFAGPAQALYRALIDPASAQLRGRKTFVIVPDGFLWQLPFQALIGPRGRYLIEEVAVSYTPSLTVLNEMLRLKKQRLAGGQVLIVGAAVLPGMRREAEGLVEIYGASKTRLLLGPAADEPQIRREAPRSRIVHLAAHGVFRDENPMSSFLRVARGGAAEAGQLEARDMMSLNLSAEMVVLSGCETARGGGSNGEGLIGMSWALFVAGTPTTVASQWKVDAASTSDLMLRFHRGVAESGGKSRSMQLAELAIMKRPESRHPFYWSGFMVIGEGF